MLKWYQQAPDDLFLILQQGRTMALALTWNTRRGKNGEWNAFIGPLEATELTDNRPSIDKARQLIMNLFSERLQSMIRENGKGLK